MQKRFLAMTPRLRPPAVPAIITRRLIASNSLSLSLSTSCDVKMLMLHIIYYALQSVFAKRPRALACARRDCVCCSRSHAGSNQKYKNLRPQKMNPSTPMYVCRAHLSASLALASPVDKMHACQSNLQIRF